MPYGDDILTSLRGRRLGLQRLTSGQHGGNGDAEMLVGPVDFRLGVTTDETTGANLKAHGMSHIPGTSAASSSVYVLDPPIPGVRKIIWPSTDNGPTYVKTANGEAIHTRAGSSFNTVKASSSCFGALQLIGLSTAAWLGMGITSGTSEFELTTST